MFGFLKRRKKTQPEEDPLRAFDAVIEELERQGMQLRRSAATLLALRGQLTRDMERYQAQRQDVQARLDQARAAGEDSALRVLERDREQAQALEEATQKSLAQVSTDAELLLEASEDVTRRLGDLKVERQSAAARLRAGHLVTLALRQRMEKFQQVMALDAARDEVERAHQLAEVYRAEKVP